MSSLSLPSGPAPSTWHPTSEAPHVMIPFAIVREPGILRLDIRAKTAGNTGVAAARCLEAVIAFHEGRTIHGLCCAWGSTADVSGLLIFGPGPASSAILVGCVSAEGRLPPSSFVELFAPPPPSFGGNVNNIDSWCRELGSRPADRKQPIAALRAVADALLSTGRAQSPIVRT